MAQSHESLSCNMVMSCLMWQYRVNSFVSCQTSWAQKKAAQSHDRLSCNMVGFCLSWQYIHCSNDLVSWQTSCDTYKVVQSLDRLSCIKCVSCLTLQYKAMDLSCYRQGVTAGGPVSWWTGPVWRSWLVGHDAYESRRELLCQWVKPRNCCQVGCESYCVQCTRTR